MLEQNLKDIWKNSSRIEKIKFDLSRLVLDLNGKMKSIEKAIRTRDIREIGASVFGVLLFGYFAIEIPFPITKIASVLTIGWFIYIIFKLKKNKNTKVPIDMSASFNDQLDQQKNNMVQEAKLLNSVLYWYVLPPFILNIIFILGIGNPLDYNWSSWAMDVLPVELNDKVRLLTLIGLFNVFVVWLNKRAVKKSITPIIKEIETVQSQLQSDAQNI
jgi:hypothetical protein